jgi:hypothetical protein
MNKFGGLIKRFLNESSREEGGMSIDAFSVSKFKIISVINDKSTSNLLIIIIKGIDRPCSKRTFHFKVFPS